MKTTRIAALLAFALFATAPTHAQGGFGTVPQQWTIVTTSESSPNAMPITTTPTGAPDPCTTGQNDNPNDTNPSCYNPLVLTTAWQLSTNFIVGQTISTPQLPNTFTNSSCSATGGVQSMDVTGADNFGYVFSATITVTLQDNNGATNTIVFMGRPSSGGTQFTGTFTSSGPCMNNDSGNFTASLFLAINGTYRGSFETNGNFGIANGGSLSIAFNTDSNFNVTGNVMANNGAKLCFTNLTIATTLANTYGASLASGDMLEAIASDSTGNVVMFIASATDGNGLPEGNDKNGNQLLYLTYQGLAGACSGIFGVDVPFSKVAPARTLRHRPIRVRPENLVRLAAIESSKQAR